MNKSYLNLVQCAYVLEGLTHELMDSLFVTYDDQMLEIELDEWQQVSAKTIFQKRQAIEDDNNRLAQQHYEKVFGEKLSKYSYYLEKY